MISGILNASMSRWNTRRGIVLWRTRVSPLFSLLSLVASGLGFFVDGDGCEVLFLATELVWHPD